MKTLIVTNLKTTDADELARMVAVFGRESVAWAPPAADDIPVPMGYLRGKLVLTRESAEVVKMYMPHAFVEQAEFIEYADARAIAAGPKIRRHPLTPGFLEFGEPEPVAKVCIDLVEDDAAAMGFQTIGQYRSWLSKSIREATK